MPLNDAHIRAWSLHFSDAISTTLKLNVHAKDITHDERLYRDVIKQSDRFRWSTVCDYEPAKQTVLMIIPYDIIHATTHHMFSPVGLCIPESIDTLTFTETMIAKELSKAMVPAFQAQDITLSWVRHEPKIGLVHPFHEDETIRVHAIQWHIGTHAYGDLHLCHSHVL